MRPLRTSSAEEGQKFSQTFSLKNELRDGTIVLSSTLSSSTSMMADNKPRRVHHLNGIIFQFTGAIHRCIRSCYEK
jgi:hypothetical protein